MFSKLAKSRDGLQDKCKKCFSEYNKLHYQKNRARKLAQVKERADRIGTKNIYAHNREWFQEYYRKNREQILERTKAYSKANREQKRAIKSRRRMRENVGMSRLDRKKSTLYRKLINDMPCHYCGKFSDHMNDDHYYPLAKGGTDHWWNLVRACETCNKSKNARLASSFR